MRQLAVVVLLTALAIQSQNSHAGEHFAVASIRPVAPQGGAASVVGGAIQVIGRRFSATNASIKDLMSYAYMIHAQQIAGGPLWINSDRFDVVAESDMGDLLQPPSARRMVEQLLAERFSLKTHQAKQKLAIYKIVSAGREPVLNKSAGDANGFGTFGFPMLGRMVLTNTTIAEFANFLQRYVLDRPVLDQSGLVERYDFTLDWTADDTQFAGRTILLPPPVREIEPPDLFTAFQQQLGLRLVPRKELAPVMVIDEIRRPTEN